MAIELSKLAAQGRAFSGARPWTPEELDALLALERDRGLGRLAAAEYIRNGVVTLAGYDAAVEAKFAPKTLEEATGGVEEALQEHGKEFAGVVSKPKKAAKK